MAYHCLLWLTCTTKTPGHIAEQYNPYVDTQRELLFSVSEHVFKTIDPSCQNCTMLSQSVCSWLSPISCLSTSLSVSLCFCQCVSQASLESKQHSIWVCLAYSRPFSAITWAGWAASSSNPRLLCGSVVYASTTFSFVISIRIMGNVWSCIWNNSIYIIILLLCNITRHQKQGHCVGPHLLLLHELQKILH